jgi:hypothetical protein
MSYLNRNGRLGLSCIFFSKNLTRRRGRAPSLFRVPSLAISSSVTNRISVSHSLQRPALPRGDCDFSVALRPGASLIPTIPWEFSRQPAFYGIGSVVRISREVGFPASSRLIGPWWSKLPQTRFASPVPLAAFPTVGQLEIQRQSRIQLVCPKINKPCCVGDFIRRDLKLIDTYSHKFKPHRITSPFICHCDSARDG